MYAFLMRAHPLVVGVAITLVPLAGCKKQKDERAAITNTTNTGSGEASAVPTTDAPPSTSPSPDSAKPRPVGPGEQEVTGDFKNPESIFHDTATDTYLVSNINGSPVDHDDNGFISKVSPDGKIVELKWIDGAKPDVTLDAPKGMTISGDTLWVTDIDKVRTFDAKTGKPTGEIAIPSSTFANDVVPDGAGGVYASETAIDGRFEPTGADGIYHISKDRKLTARATGRDLGRPNGLWPAGDALWVVSFGSGEIYQVTKDGTLQPPTKLPQGQLDGIVVTPSGAIVVASWEGQALYRGSKDGKTWEPLVMDVQSPADIGLDAKRKRILIPLLQDNKLLFVPAP